MDFVRGLIVRASAGRDKGGFFAVLAAGDDGYALICDGRRRRLEHPKRKKVKHLFPTSAVLAEGSMQTNREIRKALAAYRNGGTVPQEEAFECRSRT